MSRTSRIFKKHFGNTPVVCLSHPNIESFFSELNEDCKKEDEVKRLEALLVRKEYEISQLEDRIETLNNQLNK